MSLSSPVCADSRSTGCLRKVLFAAPVYILFFATGMCCALPGALSPALMHHWALDDRHIGFFFFSIWAGSSFGSLAVRGRLFFWTALGCASTAIAAYLMASAAGPFAPACGALYGLGLGMAMTSISLTRQQQAADRRTELVRLNLGWAMGACVSPSLMSSALRSGRIAPVLLAVAAFFAVSALWTVLFQSRAARTEAASGFNAASWRALLRLPMPLVIATALVTGIEASAGAWLATYAHREQHTLLLTVGAPTCLWAGLMTSRIFESLPHLEAHVKRVLPVLLVAVLAGSLLLLAWPTGSVLLVGSFVLGCGLGPLYPILLARVVAQTEGAPIFFLAGVFSAVMPWATGVFSTHTGSIRGGLIVPAAGAALMLVLGLSLGSAHDVEEVTTAQASTLRAGDTSAAKA